MPIICLAGSLGLAMVVVAISSAQSYNVFMVRGGSDERDHQCACQENLRLLDHHKQQWALDHNQTGYATPSWDDLVTTPGIGCIEYFTVQPVCPAGGTYTIGQVDDRPSCSFLDAPYPHEWPELPRQACYPLPRDMKCYCQNILVRLVWAKDSWSINTNSSPDAVPTWDDLITTDSWYFRVIPICPNGGTYSLNAVAEHPSCSFQDFPNPHIYPPIPGVCYPTDIDYQCYCDTLLQKIYWAKHQWAWENKMPGSAIPEWDDLISTRTGYLSEIPECLAGGIYTLNAVDDDPMCSLSDQVPPHMLGRCDRPLNEESSRRLCQENLQKIDGAKQQWGLDLNLPGDAVPTWDDLVVAKRTGYLQQTPVCPRDGTYTINSLNETPTCSYQYPCPHFLP